MIKPGIIRMGTCTMNTDFEAMIEQSIAKWYSPIKTDTSSSLLNRSLFKPSRGKIAQG
jgi:hypothetical protein